MINCQTIHHGSSFRIRMYSPIRNPYGGYPTEDQITEMKESMTRDFVGVKIGDINSSAVAP